MRLEKAEIVSDGECTHVRLNGSEPLQGLNSVYFHADGYGDVTLDLSLDIFPHTSFEFSKGGESG